MRTRRQRLRRAADRRAAQAPGQSTGPRAAGPRAAGEGAAGDNVNDVLRAAFATTLASLRTRQDEWTPRCLGAARDHVARGGSIVLIAFGKAARSMAQSALAVLPAHRVRGLLVTPAPDAAPLPPLRTIAAGHPLPDAGSFAAARAALALCRSARPTEHVEFLVSGGGSALLELPYDDRIDVASWRAFYRALVGCGAGIERVNAIRRRVSAIKGGRLALAAAAAAGQTTVLVRDVPGDWGDIASGPTWLADADDASDEVDPDDASPWLDDAALARELDALGLWHALPAQLAADLAAGALPPRPQVPDQLHSKCAWLTLLSEEHALAFAAQAMAAAGFVVDAEADADDQPVDAAADALLQRLAALRTAHPGRKVAVVTTGELSVRLPSAPGVGGRNQHFALACAQRIAGQPIA
ncbi:MAG: glycerate kinase, partial [Planctomycetes bacterium]|nr:glycerate kinase [Planctomycetota bacterium]